MQNITGAIKCNSKRENDAIHTVASTPSSSTSGCVSGDEHYDTKNAVPSSLVTAENYLTISEEALALSSVDDLTRAVDQCKDMVLETPECSEERKWLVRRLIELRFRLQEMKEAAEEGDNQGFSCSEVRVILGHHFLLQSEPTPTTRHHCDRCSGIIWGVVHSWYQCTDCKYSCHVKCLPQVCRICAHVRASETNSYIVDICPEEGLSTQSYKCAECKAHITFTFPKGLSCFGRSFSSENSWVEPRLCDYDGQYYCPNCHWNSVAVIPARVIHNWDFEERRICRSSEQLLTLVIQRPVLKLQKLNPRLFGLVEELSLVKKMREDIMMMKRYFILCKEAIENRILWQLQDRQYFAEDVDLYSLQDLIDVNNRKLLEYLEKILAVFTKHIKEDCTICSGRGYFCELCDEKEVIFPFDGNASSCDKCFTAFHKSCCNRKNFQCPKCIRIEKRASLLLEEETNDKVVNT